MQGEAKIAIVGSDVARRSMLGMSLAATGSLLIVGRRTFAAGGGPTLVSEVANEAARCSASMSA